MESAQMIYIIILFSCVGNVAMVSPQPGCHFWYAGKEPAPITSCDGRNRTAIPARDSRGIFNMSGREALRIIDVVHQNREDCSRLASSKLVPILNIRYESDQFKRQANTAVRLANQMSEILTRGLCNGNSTSKSDDVTQYVNDNILYSLAHGNVASHPSISGTAIIFKKGVYKGRKYFAPYAFKRRTDNYVRTQDLSLTWGPLQTNFMVYVENISQPRSFLCETSILKPRYNESFSGPVKYYTHAKIEFSDGIWARPYFECHASRSWIVSYVAPFMTFDYRKNSSKSMLFLGGVSVDVDLNKVDINQCDKEPAAEFPFEVFAGTHHCKTETTKCEHVPGLGFSVGSYKCVCKDGYYFPIVKAARKYFNGSEIEDDIRNGGRMFSLPTSYRCLQCTKGCDTCVDNSPCLAAFNLPLRYGILTGIVLCILCTFGLAWVVYSQRKVKVMKSASPKFLLVTLIGACLMYLQMVITFPRVNDVTCALRPWLKNIGFGLLFGAILLKNWRISQIFQIKSAKRVRITDEMLLRKFAPILGFYALYLSTWTITAASYAVEKKTADSLKFYECSEDWWDYAVLIGNFVFMLWGIYLCYTVRKAPSAFNESKFISWSIYNITVVTVLMKLMRAFLVADSGPDTSYLLEFLELQLTVSVLLALVFLPKVIRLIKGRGNESDMNSGALKNKSLYVPGSSNDTMQIVQENETLKTEIRKLYAEIEMVKLAKIDEVHRKMSRTISLINDFQPLPPSPLENKEERRKTIPAAISIDTQSSYTPLGSPKVELVDYI